MADTGRMEENRRIEENEKLEENGMIEGNGNLEENGKMEEDGKVGDNEEVKVYEPEFKLPEGWVDDPETMCYTCLATGDIFCYRQEYFCFVDAPPRSTVPKDSQTKLETADKFCAKEEPLDFVDNEIEAMKTVPRQSQTTLETRDKFCAKEEPFDFFGKASAAMETVPKQSQTKLETGDEFCTKEQPFDFFGNAIAAMKTVPKQEISYKEVLPLRLVAGNGPRIHRQLAIEYGVADKRCNDCGQVGQLTCFSNSFRKWALRRVTREELNQICSRCHERGHNCLNCDIPITYKLPLFPVPKARKVMRCSICGEAGHNKRSCFLSV